jgi:hypothetical protein
MHLSTVHGSSYYSAGVNSAHTLVRRAEMGSNMWIGIAAGIFVLFVLVYVGHAFAQRKFDKDMRQKKHAQWYGQQRV